MLLDQVLGPWVLVTALRVISYETLDKFLNNSLSLRFFNFFKWKHIILSVHISEMYITYLLMCLYIVHMLQMSVLSHFFLTVKSSFYSINIYNLTKNKETMYVCFRSVTKKEWSPEDSLLLVNLTAPNAHTCLDSALLSCLEFGSWYIL